MPTKELLRLVQTKQIRYVMIDGIAHVPEDVVEEYRAHHVLTEPMPDFTYQESRNAPQ